jgi:Beta-propeller repeat
VPIAGRSVDPSAFRRPGNAPNWYRGRAQRSTSAPLLPERDCICRKYTSSVTRLANTRHQCWAWITLGFVLIALGATARAQTTILPQGPRNALTYSAYLGGSSNDAVHAVAVDSRGNVYLAGETVSSDFPVTPGAFQTKHGGRPGNDCSIFTGCYLPDAFVTKLDPSGKIVYSTYLGGSNSDVAVGIAVDAQGDAYVAGTTSSSNFPVTAGAFQTTPLNNSTHAFILKLNPSGSSLIFSTLVGGSGIESVAGIRIDAAGNVFLAGGASSADFPVTSGAFQTAASKAANPAMPLSHGFVLKLNAMGSALSYSTYLSALKGHTRRRWI